MNGTDPQTLVAVVVGLVVSGVLVYAVIRSQTFAAALILALFVVMDATRIQASLSVTLGGLHVYALDVLCAVLIVVSAFRSLTGRARGALLGLAWLTALLLLFHIVRGVSDFGLQAAINSSRPWLYFLAPLLFAATAPAPWRLRVWKLVAATGLVLVVVSLGFFLTEGIHSASRMIVQNGQLVSDRPITAAGALVVLEATIIILALGGSVARRSGPLLAAIAVADIVVLQQRTIWVAGLVVGLLGFVGWSRIRFPQNEAVVFGATGALLMAAPIAVWGFLADSSLRASLTETTAGNSTFAWRTESWRELISSHHSALDLASGGPAGASWARAINGTIAVQAPHDAFVEAFLRFGLPGAALFGGLFNCAVGKTGTLAGAASGLHSTAVGLIVASQLVFCITYTLDSVQGLIIGIFVSSLMAERTVAAGGCGSQLRAPRLVKY